jgi:hypothetical protein
MIKFLLFLAEVCIINMILFSGIAYLTYKILKRFNKKIF